MAISFKEKVTTILKSDTRLLDSDGELMVNKVHNLVENIDEKLIEILLQDLDIKQKFFKEIKDSLVFKSNDFKFYLDENKLDNSYTKFENRIGLTVRGKFLEDTSDVVLDFPYKDCIIEGGQSSEEGLDVYFEFESKDDHYVEKKSKRKEIFYNRVLARDEIDRLLEPKSFKDARRFSRNAETSEIHFRRNENGLIEDNLLMKGNNYLVLNSVLPQFANRIKLIYIDPPYNTGNDGFKYNDNFNHSTWLTFMKNRLEVAKNLLSDEGSIFISIDENELGYLQVLCDNIFGRDNRANLICVKRGSVTGHKSINPGAVNVSEYILAYTKNKSSWKPNRIQRERSRNDRYNNFILHRDLETKHWKFVSLLDAFSEEMEIPKSKLKKELGEKFEYEIFEFIKKNASKVIQFAFPDKEKVSKEVKEKIDLSEANPDTVYQIVREKESDIYLVNGQRILFYSDRLYEIDGKLVTGEPVSDFWDDVLPNDLHSEGGVSFKKGKKSEKLIQRVIELASDEGDYVLDFHLGSGTTACVALKLQRKFIGVEQLDYGDNGAVSRLINTMNGETSGISKVTGWKGGGDFVYLELAKNNQLAIDRILCANNYGELLSYFDEMYAKFFLSYNLKIKDFKENLSNQNVFKALPLEKQKMIFLKMLDLNQLYINVSDMEDERFGLSKADIAVTKSFYQI